MPPDIHQRIAQFENMVQADPTNDMAHFSLGGAYAQAERHIEAAESYLRCIQLNPLMSKAYQLAGQAYIKAAKNDDAARVLTDGYTVAAERGDRMPMMAMGDLLKSINRPIPAVKTAAVAHAAGPGDFVCQRTGRAGNKLPSPPFKGPVGQWIFQNISRETFDDWIKQGTKVINELRLDLSRDADEKVYDQHMREYLGLDDETYTRLTQTR